MTIPLQILLRFWKPIAAALAGIFAYGKGRADANRKAETDGLKDTIKAKELRDEADTDAATGDARDGLRDDWTRR